MLEKILSDHHSLLLLVLLSTIPVHLQAQPLSEDWYLYSDQAHLYVTEIGRGDTVVVLHGGWGAEHSYLLDAVEGLENDFRFVLYDQRGSLRSPSPDSLISVEQHVEDLDQLRQVLGLDRMTLLAHSMGTFLAMSYLDTHPERVKRLVLCAAIPAKMDGLSFSPEALAFMEREGVQAQIAKEGLEKDRITSKEDSHIWKIRFAATNIYHIERWRQVKGGRAFHSERASEAAVRTMPDRWDFVPRLRSHPHPVTVIIGDHDFADWQAARWSTIAEEVPNLELVLLEKAGHNAWIDQPVAFQRSLTAALSNGDD